MAGHGQPTKWDAWYSSGRWARIRKQQLLAHPLCHFCLERGIVTPATIRDHVEPHHGDVNKFWLGPFQSLCKRCHDSAKRFVESRGYRPDVRLDGWPLDPNHPVYRTR
jgi:hypothetical protein